MSEIEESTQLLQEQLRQLRAELAVERDRFATLNARMNLINRATQEGIWDVEVVNDNPFLSRPSNWWGDNYRLMLGCETEDEFLSFAAHWIDKIHPQDRETTVQAFKRHVEDATGSTHYDVEYRLLTKSHGYRWFRARGAVLRDEQGRAIRSVGSMADISEQKSYELSLIERNRELARLNAELTKSQARFELVNAAVSEGLWEFILEGGDISLRHVKVWWADKLRAMLGYVDEADFPCTLQTWTGSVHRQDIKRMVFAFQAHLADRSGNTPYDIELRVRRKDGSWGWYRARGATLRDRDGVPLRVAGSLADISLRKRQDERILTSSLEAAQKTNALIEIKEKTRLEAERRNNEKSLFLANAVHDLRQPIQAISNALEPVKESIEKNNLALTHMLIDLAQDAAGLMRKQLSAILEISRLESGFAQAKLVGVDLIKLVSGVVEQLQPTAAKDNVRLNVIAPSPHVVAVYTDHNFLARILANIIGNSIKYHDYLKGNASYVNIRIVPSPAHVTVEVEDNGIGIAQEHLVNDAIFKPFFQLHNRRNESEKGVGLGLSIVNAMLALMPDHRLEVRSEISRGTTFRLELPRASSSLVAVDAPVNPDDIKAYKADLHGRYVLMVEDDDFVRTTTLALLAHHGLLTEGVATLAELVTLLPTLERVPDLVLSDYRLPEEKTAIDVANAVYAALGKVPLLILTADSVAQQLAQQGLIFKTLTKPVASAELLEAMSLAIQAKADSAEAL